MLPVLANFAGIAAALLLPSTPHGPHHKDKQEDASGVRKGGNCTKHQLKFMMIGGIEVLGNVLGTQGLIYAGSGLFQVVYSSVVLFTALLSKFFLSRSPQPKQWLALLLIFLGLAFSALGGAQKPKSASVATDASSTTTSTMIGIFLTLLCAVTYSSSYITVEWFLQDASDPPSERDLQGYSGLCGLSIILLYTTVHTIPNWNHLVTDNIAAKHGSPTRVLVDYIIVALSGFFHSVSYYKLVGSVGAVSTGVLQALRAVSVFGLSSLAFCGDHPEQCVNGPKIVSMIVVAAGLIGYSNYALPKKPIEVISIAP